MRDPLHSLRRLPLALQFGLKLDLKAVEEEIERQDKLSDGASPDAARNVSTILRQSHFVFRLERLAGGLAD